MERLKEVDMGKMIPFDTLAYAKKLEACGVINTQAEAHASALAEVLEVNFVTKQDAVLNTDNVLQRIDLLHKDMDARFKDVDAEFKAVRNEAATEAVALRSEMAAGFAAVHAEMGVRFARVDAEFKAVRNEAATEAVALRSEMAAGFAAVHAEMDVRFARVDTEFAAVRGEMKEEFAAVRGEMKEGFERVTSQNTKCMVGILLTQLAIIIPTLIKFMH